MGIKDAIVVHLDFQGLAFSVVEFSPSPLQSTCLMDRGELSLFFLPGEVPHQLHCVCNITDSWDEAKTILRLFRQKKTCTLTETLAPRK